MKHERALMELTRCLDEARSAPAGLARRLEADLRLRRRARALRRVDERLRQELTRLNRAPLPSLAPGVLAALASHPRRASGPWARRVVLAAAALVLAWGALPHGEDRGARHAQRPAAVSPLAAILPWHTPLRPGTLAPEAALVEEAHRLAADTRHVARSLWRRLPLAGWLTRDAERAN